jgi:hypothetical protein
MSSVQVRVIISEPPPGVRLAVQRGKAELLEASTETVGLLQFDFSLRLGEPQADGSPNFLGEFAQGPQAERFVYVNSGTLAGQAGSVWTRRAKLKLGPIPRALVDAALADPERVLVARLSGTARDGGPIFASLKPETVTWELA